MCARSRTSAPSARVPASTPALSTTDALQHALRRLGALDRIIVDLHVRDGLSFREVARRLGRSPGTVSRRWYERILPRLRDDAASR